jgi:two-component system sensor histidine kinase YesM
LVENCILHGFKDMETGGLITIRGYEAKDALMFVVRDNGGGMTQAQLDALLDGKDQASIGLANVQRRIQLICGAEYCLHATSSVGHGSTVTVRVSKESTMK